MAWSPSVALVKQGLWNIATKRDYAGKNPTSSNAIPEKNKD
jgi:hypothetical protein